MLFRTHIAIGLLTGLYLIDFLKIKSQILFIIVLLFFSVFPDIDQGSSKVFKKLKPFSYLASLPGHRRIFHSIYFPAAGLALLIMSLSANLSAVSGLSPGLSDVLKMTSIAAITGYLLHLFFDMLTKKGISPFYPLSRRRIRGPIKVGSLAESLFFIGLIVLMGYKLISG